MYNRIYLYIILKWMERIDIWVWGGNCIFLIIIYVDFNFNINVKRFFFMKNVGYFILKINYGNYSYYVVSF